MKLGIDARPLQGETRFRGIGKTLENVLEATADLPTKNIEYVFYVDSGFPVPKTLDLFPTAKRIFVNSPAINKKRYIRALLPALTPIKPSVRDIDILLQYDALLGVPKNVPTVVIFYDLIPYLFKDKEREAQKPSSMVKKLKHDAGKRIHWKKYINMLKRYRSAKHIISISEASKKDLLKFMPDIPAKRITPVLLGVSPKPAPAKVRTEVKRLAANKYLLYVGGIDIRKNIIGLLQSFFEVKSTHPDIKLLAVGKEFDLHGHLEDLGWNQLLRNNPELAKDVITPGYVSDDELRYLYKHALIFVFPSRYEGFGLPVLEAIQQGCPVITYRNSSLTEIAADAALLVEDGGSIVQPILRLLGNDVFREELKQKGALHVKNYRWDKTAEKTLEVVRKVYEETH